jgi:hypothetical protein
MSSPTPISGIDGLAPDASDGVPVLRQATAKLRDIAVAVDLALAVLDPTVELLEASHAIHRALVLLIDWRAARDDIGHLTACDAVRRCERLGPERHPDRSAVTPPPSHAGENPTPSRESGATGKGAASMAGTAEDIALVAIYLVSDESSQVTGQNFEIDGGASAGVR